jgi:hypothetical protein
VEGIIAHATRDAVDKYTVRLAAQTQNLAAVACQHCLGDAERRLLHCTVIPLLRDTKVGLAVTELFRDTLAANVARMWKLNRPHTGKCIREDRAAVDAAIEAIREAVDAWLDCSGAARVGAGATLVCAIEGASPWERIGAWYQPK